MVGAASSHVLGSLLESRTGFAERGRKRPPPLNRVDPHTTKRGVSVCPHFLASISCTVVYFMLAAVELRSRIMFLSISCERGAKQTTNSK